MLEVIYRSEQTPSFHPWLVVEIRGLTFFCRGSNRRLICDSDSGSCKNGASDIVWCEENVARIGGYWLPFPHYNLWCIICHGALIKKTPEVLLGRLEDGEPLRPVAEGLDKHLKALREFKL
jgi:hypothetical protein